MMHTHQKRIFDQVVFAEVQKEITNDNWEMFIDPNLEQPLTLEIVYHGKCFFTLWFAPYYRFVL